jgi:hypothetical protein
VSICFPLYAARFASFSSELNRLFITHVKMSLFVSQAQRALQQTPYTIFRSAAEVTLFFFCVVSEPSTPKPGDSIEK